MDAVLILDKPKGITSQKALSIVKRALGEKSAGYTGTLDPFATGVLPICLGEATKIIPFMDEEFKIYEAELLLGIRTDTLDVTGKILSNTEEGGEVKESALLDALSKFRGEILQTPPMFSALKVKGERLYAMARRGEEIEREARPITVKELRLLDFAPPRVKFSVTCSRGTYVRSLGADIGDRLGCGGCLSELRRVSSGAYDIHSALPIDDVKPDAEVFMTMREALSNLGEISLRTGAAGEIRSGRQIVKSFLDLDGAPQFHKGERFKICEGGGLISIAEAEADSLSLASLRGGDVVFRLLRVFN